MPISAVDTIPLAVEHTRQQLFNPFRFGQWTKLAIVGLLAGELGSGGCNTNLPSRTGGIPHTLPDLAAFNYAVLAGLIATVVVAAVLVGLILMYISSVMRFILFDSVIAKQCRIRAGWGRRQSAGWRYFLWHIFYVLSMFAGFVILIGIPAAFAFGVGWMREPKQHILPLVLLGIVVFFVILFFWLAMSVIFVLTKDFVVPQMALENIGAFEGWRRLWHMIDAELGAYAAYVGIKIALAIGAGIVVGIATIILGLIIAIPTVLLSVLAVVTGKSAGLNWNVYTITLAIVIGSILLAVFLYLISLISVPVIVFFPAYSIYFFAARYAPLNAVLYPVPIAAAPQTLPGAIPPFEPPQFPPSAEPIG